jgi:hypothetical protein
MGSLTAEQGEQFHRQGYLLVEALFDPEEDIEPIIEEYKGVLDKLASELYASGMGATLTRSPPYAGDGGHGTVQSMER